MKKILTIMIIMLSIFLIYLGFKDKNIYYLSIGDSLAYGTTPYGGKDYGYAEFVRDYLEQNKKLEVFVDDLVAPNKRTIDIMKDIKDNVLVNVNGKKKTFQNVLIKADLVTLSIGINDFLNETDIDNEFSLNDLYDKFEKGLDDLEQLLKLMHEYCKEDILLIGYFNPTQDSELDEFISYMNKRVSALANSYNMEFINVQNELKNRAYFPNSKSYFPDKDGYQVISNQIIRVIDEKILKRS